LKDVEILHGDAAQKKSYSQQQLFLRRKLFIIII